MHHFSRLSNRLKYVFYHKIIKIKTKQTGQHGRRKLHKNRSCWTYPYLAYVI